MNTTGVATTKEVKAPKATVITEETKSLKAVAPVASAPVADTV